MLKSTSPESGLERVWRRLTGSSRKVLCGFAFLPLGERSYGEATAEILKSKKEWGEAAEEVLFEGENGLERGNGNVKKESREGV